MDAEVKEECGDDYVNLLNKGPKRPKLPKVEHDEVMAEVKNDGSSAYEESKTGSRNLFRQSDIELMQEFEEETETIFKQSETCYTHYKAMLKKEK